MLEVLVVEGLATQQQHVDRAPRYRLSLPVRYRCDGDDTWHEGTTENISSTGVLFYAPSSVASAQSLEIKVILNIEFGTMAMGEITCNGHVVRSEERQPDSRTMIAAVLSNHTFLVPMGVA
jgi:hypothetical protein